jgi:hypothetical protein
MTSCLHNVLTFLAVMVAVPASVIGAIFLHDFVHGIIRQVSGYKFGLPKWMQEPWMALPAMAAGIAITLHLMNTTLPKYVTVVECGSTGTTVACLCGR